MSARTPFIPPGTGTRQDPQDEQCNNAVDASLFFADSTNPLHQNSVSDVSMSNMDSTAATNIELGKTSTGSADDTLMNKPLNVNGLIRGKTRSKPQDTPRHKQNGQGKTSFNGHGIMRPGTADPTRQPHTVTIAAPIPFKASRTTPALLLNGPGVNTSSRTVSPLSFRTPALPPAHPPDDVFANNAHIPTESHAPTHNSDAMASVRTFGGQMNDRSSERNALDNLGQLPNGFAMHLNGDQPDVSHLQMKSVTNNSSRRRKNEAENAVRSDTYSRGPKRMKRDDSRGPSVKPDHSDVRGLDSYQQWAYHQNIPQGTTEQHHADVHHVQLVENHTYPGSEVASIDQQFVEYGGGLDRLLGLDANAYNGEYLAEKYEQAVVKWRNCSLEEWFAGAEEIKSKYCKIFDFVKDHMSSKVDLYASFDKKIENHNDTLHEREEMLSAVQAQLVKESESVLGRSLGT
ncbi:hypothetical protein AX17_005522 [Amanita inopinata Kibby_2008]|nr:hypothetical protein AX17_005522 [Amanita inopinata Kibby_2008]